MGPHKKVYVPHFLGNNAKRDPHKLFRGNFGGQNQGPKRAIFGHKKFGLLFFPALTHPFSQIDGNAPGGLLQTPAAVLDKISGPKGEEIVSSIGLQFGTLIETAQLLPVPALDENQSPPPPPQKKVKKIDRKGHFCRVFLLGRRACRTKLPPKNF